MIEMCFWWWSCTFLLDYKRADVLRFFLCQKTQAFAFFHWRKVREPQEALMSRRVIMSWRLMGKCEWFFHCRCPTWVLQIDCGECGTPTTFICLTWLLSTILWIHRLDSSWMRWWTYPGRGKACTREWCSWLRTTEGWKCWISEQIQQCIGSINGPPIISTIITISVTTATKSMKSATLLQMYAAMEDQFFCNHGNQSNLHNSAAADAGIRL